MSCDSWTYDTAVVDLAARLSARVELDHDPPAREPESQHGKSLKQGRPGVPADQPAAKGHRREIHSRTIPDSTQTEPEYVWGDEGPIND